MPKFKKVYAWKEDGKFVSSLQPRGAKTAKNMHDHPLDVVREARGRGMAVEWEKPDEIDAHLMQNR